jgi:predicted dinucleotide-binding enzyme
VLVAIPSQAIGDAFGKVTGVGDAVVIDAMNAFTGRNEEFASLAHEVKSHVDGPVAKSFNCNFAVLYDGISDGLGGRFFYRYAKPGEL